MKDYMPFFDHFFHEHYIHDVDKINIIKNNLALFFYKTIFYVYYTNINFNYILWLLIFQYNITSK